MLQDKISLLMEDGQQNKKVAFIIQARMGSSRLPGKILMNIPMTSSGKPLLEWILDDLKYSCFQNEIIVASSIGVENDQLESFCEVKGIHCYRGDENDVLSRFIDIANLSNYDCIVRMTADNPIVDIKLLDQTIKYHIEQDNDYTNTSALPLGMNFEVISPKSILELTGGNLTTEEKEHVTLFIKNQNRYKKGTFDPSLGFNANSLRLTVDYPSDFLVVSWVLQMRMELGMRGIELVKFLNTSYSFMFQINQDNHQMKHFANPRDEIKYAANMLENKKLSLASKILHDHFLNDLL